MGLDDDIAILADAPLFGFLDRDALRLLPFDPAKALDDEAANRRRFRDVFEK